MIDALQLGRLEELYDLWAYVVMPEHVHMIVLPRAGIRVSSILRTLKQSVSQRAILWLKRNRPGYLAKLAHHRNTGEVVHHFWQRGGGYDRNLRSEADVHEKIHYIHANPVLRGLVERPEQWAWSSQVA